MRPVRALPVCKRREQKQHLPRLSRMSWLRCMLSWLTQRSLPLLSDDGGSTKLTAVCPAPAAKARKLYQATVDDLSNKIISVKQLLHFFHEVFKHSASPMGTTTEEVVAELIVPITAVVSMSWVDYLMSFADSSIQLIAARTAQDSTTHVVHAWKMKFEDLLGAVLSHASSEMMRNFGSSYEEACQLYSEVLGRRYFICCFCINQHHSICHEPHIQCRCSAPKYDDSMPRCEINKFASVAQRIHDRGGGMLLALDRELKTLSRAWCVDEINYSIASGMSIEVAYNTRPSGLLLRKFECDVEQCQARPADKERILAKVRDGVGIATFNARVTNFIRESENRLLANVRSRACGNIFPKASIRVDALTDSKSLNPSWTHCNSSSSGRIIDTLTSQTPRAEELLAGADASGSDACQTVEEIKMEPTSSWSSASTDAPSSNIEVIEDTASLSFDSVSSHGSIDMADMTSPDSKIASGTGEEKAIPGTESQRCCLESDNFSNDDSVRHGIAILPKDDSEVDFFEKEEDIVRRGITFAPDDTLKPRKNVAIFADYDGCFDIISPSNPEGAKMDQMFDYAKQVDHLLYPREHAEKMLRKFLDEVTADAAQATLFSGSNRQCRKTDESNAVQNDNGLAMQGLKKLAEDRKWHFNSNLLGDVGLTPSSIMVTIGGSSLIKKMLAKNNFKLLTGPTEVYFFDDIEKYLKYTREKANNTENIELKTQAGDRFLEPISAGEPHDKDKA